MKTLKQIIMQKTEQWHQNNPVHILEQGLLVSKPQVNSFDKSPVFQMFITSIEEWLTQKRQEITQDLGDPTYKSIQHNLIAELLEELKQ